MLQYRSGKLLEIQIFDIIFYMSHKTNNNKNKIKSLGMKPNSPPVILFSAIMSREERSGRHSSSCSSTLHFLVNEFEYSSKLFAFWKTYWGYQNDDIPRRAEFTRKEIWKKYALYRICVIGTIPAFVWRVDERKNIGRKGRPNKYSNPLISW